MACQTCRKCLIHFPLAWNQCAACGEPLFNDNISNVDADWKEKVEKRRVFLAEKAEWDDITTPVTGRVKETKGNHTISTHEVVRSGIRHTLAPDTLIRLSDPDDPEEISFWEVQGYSYRNRVYWVKPFRAYPPKTFPEEWANGD